MAKNFTATVHYDGTSVLAVILRELRKDGFYYEVNIKGYPRFFMAWSALGRFDVQEQEGLKLPYALVLAISDAIEQKEKK